MRVGVAIAIVALGCAHAPPPARMLSVPARPTPWALEITPLGTSPADLDEAIGRSIAANASLVRVEGGAEPDGRVNVTVHTTGTPLADPSCTGDVRIVVRRAMGPPILDREEHFDQPCGWDANGRAILYDTCVAWALERSVDALSRPE
jgi:hypothetical protein